MQTEGSKPSGKVSIGVYGRSRAKEGLFADVDRATDSRTNRLDSSHSHIFITNPHDSPCQLTITSPILEMKESRAHKGTLNKQKKCPSHPSPQIWIWEPRFEPRFCWRVSNAPLDMGLVCRGYWRVLDGHVSSWTKRHSTHEGKEASGQSYCSIEDGGSEERKNTQVAIHS